MKTRRFLIYRSAKSRQYLCVCAARDKRHALTIARRMFRLERTAYASDEQPAVERLLEEKAAHRLTGTR